MNNESAFYRTKSTQMDGYVIQEIKLTDKLYAGICSVAQAENESVEHIISQFLMHPKSIFDHPHYP